MQEKKLQWQEKIIYTKAFSCTSNTKSNRSRRYIPSSEAQLDRFLMNIKINHPDQESEKKILLISSKEDTIKPRNILKSKDILQFQDLIREIPVGDSIVNYILKIIYETRPETSKIKSVKENILWGPSPRASISLLAASKAKSSLEKRYSPSKLDVKA